MNEELHRTAGLQLEELEAAGTYKHFNVIRSPQGPLVEMKGRGEVIVLSSNNYLGLANDPEVVSAGIDGFGPRPLRTSPSLARPSSANRFRQARTVTTVTPTSSAIRLLATPSAASSNALARCTCRCGADRARANTSNASR